MLWSYSSPVWRRYCHKDRRYYCVICGKTFSESRASLFYHLRTPRRDVLEAIGMLAERNSLRGIARVKGVKPDTVLHWRSRVHRPQP